MKKYYDNYMDTKTEIIKFRLIGGLVAVGVAIVALALVLTKVNEIMQALVLGLPF